MTSFTIAIQDRGVLEALQVLSGRMANMGPALQAIGEDITERTKRRFETSTGPDGAAWAPNSAVTLAKYASCFSAGYFKKNGDLNKKGQARLGEKKPLIEAGELRRQIVPQVSGNQLTVTATPVYAAIHQFGGQAGCGRKVTIPARPFLPVTQDGQLYPEEQKMVLATLQGLLLDGIE